MLGMFDQSKKKKMMDSLVSEIADGKEEKSGMEDYSPEQKLAAAELKKALMGDDYNKIISAFMAMKECCETPEGPEIEIKLGE